MLPKLMSNHIYAHIIMPRRQNYTHQNIAKTLVPTSLEFASPRLKANLCPVVLRAWITYQSVMVFLPYDPTTNQRPLCHPGSIQCPKGHTHITKPGFLAWPSSGTPAPEFRVLLRRERDRALEVLVSQANNPSMLSL